LIEIRSGASAKTLSEGLGEEERANDGPDLNRR
jgi:hypothetical protein